MSRQLRLRFTVIPLTSKSTSVSRSVNDDSSQPNKSQDSLQDKEDGHSTSSNCSQSAFNHSECSDSKEETDQI